MKSSNTMFPTADALGLKEIVAGFALEADDQPMIDYLNFFSRHLPYETLTAVHIIPYYASVTSIPVVDFYRMEMEEEDHRRQRQEILGQLKKELSGKLQLPEGATLQYVVEEGSPLEMLCEIAKDRSADLVAIGKKAGTRSHEILAKNLVRHAEGHTLIVPEKTIRRLRRILVPIDFSRNSLRALRAALSIRAAAGEEIEIYAINIYQRPNLISYKLDLTPERFEANIRENHRKGFNRFMEEQLPDHVQDVTPILVQQDAPGIAKLLVEHLDSYAINLVVMGAKGHSKLELLLLGSVTDKFLSLNEEVPTLVIK